jgi:2,4-diaminopentanoate dehydrogenase
MGYRVVQWSTGGVGSIAIRAMAQRDDMELVGVWVHSPDKAGRDAGELVGAEPLGVTASNDADALLALGPDCVCYAASGEARHDEVVADFCRMLDAGINVVTTSTPGLLYPPAWDPALVSRIEAACRRGGASIYASGLEPGFVGDHLALVLSTQCRQITSIRTQEIFLYSTYPNAFTIFEVFGFGKSADTRCFMEIPGVQAGVWGPPVQIVADRLGVKLERIRETYDKRLTERTLQVAAGTIPVGTVGAVRFETIGVVDGRDAIVIEHVNRMAPDLAPDWPDADHPGTYRVVFEGDPSMTCELRLGSVEDFEKHGMVATAMRIVNAIPAVCDARPGIFDAVQLPLTLPRQAFAVH